MVIAMERGPRRQHRGRNRATSRGVAMMGSSKGVYIAAVHLLGDVWLWVRATWHTDANLDVQLLDPIDLSYALRFANGRLILLLGQLPLWPTIKVRLYVRRAKRVIVTRWLCTLSSKN